MTRQSQKDQELFYVRMAAKSLARTWDPILPCTQPDFLVTEGGQQFGLEVIELFLGQQDKNGSSIKRTESETQKKVNALKKEYENKTNTPLIVKLVGELSENYLNDVVPFLISMDLRIRPTAYQTQFGIGYEDELSAHPALKVSVTRSYQGYSDWYCVNDRVGIVSYTPERVYAAIEKKSNLLHKYRAAAGDDVRLLIVADHRFRSSMISILEPLARNCMGFNAVYFFPYPEDVIELCARGGQISA